MKVFVKLTLIVLISFKWWFKIWSKAKCVVSVFIWRVIYRNIDKIIQNIVST